MNPTPQHLEAFERLHERCFGIGLTQEQAKETLTRLLRLYLAVTQPDEPTPPQNR